MRTEANSELLFFFPLSLSPPPPPPPPSLFSLSPSSHLSRNDGLGWPDAPPRAAAAELGRPARWGGGWCAAQAHGPPREGGAARLFAAAPAVLFAVHCFDVANFNLAADQSTRQQGTLEIHRVSWMTCVPNSIFLHPASLP